jgi:hypothetical protein
MSSEQPISQLAMDLMDNDVSPSSSPTFEKNSDENPIFNKPLYLSQNAKKFFIEADFGELKKNMTEVAGISSIANLIALFRIYIVTNGRRRTGKFEGRNYKIYSVPPLMRKYFKQELGGKLEINNYQEIPKLALKVGDKRLTEALPLVKEQHRLLMLIPKEW